MLIQDKLTGRLHEIPDQRYRSLGEYGQLYEPRWGEYTRGYGYSPRYGVGQVVYDGLGNPVGLPLVAMLAPLAAKVLPAIATKVLPAITKALPMVGNLLPGAAPAAMPAPVQSPAPPVMAPPAPASITPLPPMAVPHPMMAMIAPGVMRRRRLRSRPIRRRIAVPPPPGVVEPVREARSAEPSGAVQGWGYHGGFNGYGWR